MKKQIVSWFGVILGLVGLTTINWGAEAGVTAGSGGSNYGTLELVGQFALTNETRGVAVSGNYAYLTEYDTYSGGLHIIDVSNPAEPAEVAFVQLPQAGDLAIVENYLYVIGDSYTDGFGLHILDVSDPANPVQVNMLPGKAGIDIAGLYAYMTDYNEIAGLSVMDISNPAAPVEVGFVAVPNVGGGPAVTGTSVCVPAPDYPSSLNNGMWVVDVSNPTAPALASFVGSGSESWYAAAGEGYCYLGIPSWGVQIIDVRNPYQSQIGYWSFGYNEFISLVDDWLYLSGFNTGLHVVDVSDPANPLAITYYDGPTVYTVAAEGRMVYAATVSDDAGMLILSHVAQVTGTIPVEGGLFASDLDGTSYLFSADTFTDTVQITHTVLLESEVAPTGDLIGINHTFEAAAVYSGTGQTAVPSQPYVLTVQYSEEERGAAIEETLALYYWDGSGWVREESSVVDPANNILIATPERFGRWAVLGETRRTFLPFLRRW
jgi:hypothetical protein